MINEKLTRSKKRKAKKKDACYHKVKARYSVWPSAYASGALVKCRRKGSKNWGSKKKNESIHNAYFNLAACLFEAEFGAGIKREVPVGKRKFGAGLKPKFGAGLEKKSGELAAEKARADQAAKKTAAEQEAKERVAGTSRGPEDSNAALAIARKKEAEKKLTPKTNPTFSDRAAVSTKSTEQAKARAAERRARAQEKAKAKKAKADARKERMEREKGTLKGAIKNKLRDVRDNAVTGVLSARGIRRGIGNIRKSMALGRARARAGRPSMGPDSGGFGEHAEYQRIGFIIAEKSAAWTRKEGKNPSGGLNAKGVASYRAKNPGSKLKTAVTTKPSKLKKGSKAASRRKSFCARMSGMRKRQKASNNTGKDRLSLSLKKWNC
jgi:hypothetical protein